VTEFEVIFRPLSAQAEENHANTSQYYSGTHLERLRKITKTFYHSSSTPEPGTSRIRYRRTELRSIHTYRFRSVRIREKYVKEPDMSDRVHYIITYGNDIF
jgi:hypothetical protein